MYGRHTIWFPLAILLLLALLTLWIDHAVQPPSPKGDGSSRHDPDYKMENFSAVKTDLNGNPHHLLAAVEMRHFPDDDSTELVRPRFTQYTVDKPYLQIEGQRGLVSSNGENVYFMDNVKAVRGATKDKGELTLVTDYLHIIPDQDLAVTDHPVTITQVPGTVIKANGMELNKRERTLKLSGRVHVHYQKPRAAAGAVATKKNIQKKQASKKSGAQKTPEPSPQRQPNTGNNTARVRRHYENTQTQP
ncbi:MAG TPA: LPS export ABC transporter periplasmic protein LptC [Methylophilaceae bacterium]|nr:LPS export ABC transporter periplasmic protein LptC [Methylophilaceae bacterium]HQR61219.1 LPS export ABC transporter periplasmic protein LptC [Methylophilaceae bacterium]